jgi:hypothetical protein
VNWRQLIVHHLRGAGRPMTAEELSAETGVPYAFVREGVQTLGPPPEGKKAEPGGYGTLMVVGDKQDQFLENPAQPLPPEHGG